jgi:hypothetical protein
MFLSLRTALFAGASMVNWGPFFTASSEILPFRGYRCCDSMVDAVNIGLTFGVNGVIVRLWVLAGASDQQCAGS